jgi:hypothetical protein
MQGNSMRELVPRPQDADTPETELLILNERGAKSSLEFTIVVMNTGDVPLTNVTVRRADVSTIAVIASLPVGGAETFSSTRPSVGGGIGPVTDTVSVSGMYGNTTVSATDRALFRDLLPPRIGVQLHIKRPDTGDFVVSKDSLEMGCVVVPIGTATAPIWPCTRQHAPSAGCRHATRCQHHCQHAP